MDKKISHEIGNYLHQIISHAEFISNNETKNEHIQKIKNAAYRIDALITDTTTTKANIEIKQNKSTQVNLKKFANLNILIVDDLIDNINIMNNIFSTLACNIIPAMNGEEAIKIFSNGFRPDIVCMDMIMPGIDGSVTTKELKSLGCEAYFIAISALKNQAHDITSLFDCWLPKPFTQEHIIGALSGYTNITTKKKTIYKAFKISTLDISKKNQESILYMAENGMYTSLKNLILELNNSKSKDFLISSLKKVDLEAIKKAII